MSNQIENRYKTPVVGIGGAGLILAGVGSIKISSQISSILSMGSSYCGASRGAFVGPMLADSLHWWGCPAAFAGTLLMLPALGAAFHRSEERNSSGSGNGLVFSAAR